MHRPLARLLLTIVTVATSLLLGPVGSVAAADTDGADGGWTAREGDVTVTFTPAGDASANDSSGCDGRVCIILTGSGVTLGQWRTTAAVSTADCASARFWSNGALVRSSGTYCSSGPGTLTATWDAPSRFPDNTTACNSWTDITGYPCQTIKQ